MNQSESEFKEAVTKAEELVETLVVRDILIESGLVTYSGYYKLLIEKTKELSEGKTYVLPKEIANEIIKRNSSRTEID